MQEREPDSDRRRAFLQNSEKSFTLRSREMLLVTSKICKYLIWRTERCNLQKLIKFAIHVLLYQEHSNLFIQIYSYYNESLPLHIGGFRFHFPFRLHFIRVLLPTSLYPFLQQQLTLFPTVKFVPLKYPFLMGAGLPQEISR